MNKIDYYKNIYDELVNEIEKIRKEFNSTQTNKYPTPQWVSGKFSQLNQLPSIEDSVVKNSVNNIEKLEDYKKFIALKNISIKFGLLKKEKANNGLIKYTKTDNASKFLQELQKYYKDWSSLEQTFKNVADEENREWYNSLSNNEKNLIDTYSQLDAKDYAYLLGIITRQENKKSYIDRIDSSDSKNSEILNKLVSLNLINNDFTLNNKLVNDMINFINEKTYARLKSYNKNISYITDRISADKALLRNYLNRNLDKTSNRRSDLSTRADAVLDVLTPSIKQSLINFYLSNKNYKKNPHFEELLKNDTIDSNGHLTMLGSYICKLLTSGIDIDKMQKDGEKETLYSRISKNDNEEHNLSNRKNQKAKTRSLSFKDFLNK